MSEPSAGHDTDLIKRSTREKLLIKLNQKIAISKKSKLSSSFAHHFNKVFKLHFPLQSSHLDDMNEDELVELGQILVEQIKRYLILKAVPTFILLAISLWLSIKTGIIAIPLFGATVTLPVWGTFLLLDLSNGGREFKQWIARDNLFIRLKYWFLYKALRKYCGSKYLPHEAVRSHESNHCRYCP